jgi:hypothetical protein
MRYYPIILLILWIMINIWMLIMLRIIMAMSLLTIWKIYSSLILKCLLIYWLNKNILVVIALYDSINLNILICYILWWMLRYHSSLWLVWWYGWRRTIHCGLLIVICMSLCFRLRLITLTKVLYVLITDLLIS